MARRKKISAADDLIGLVSKFPWWIGVGLAVILYAVLHRIALQPAAIVTHPPQMQATVLGALFKAGASVGQYALPLLCLAGAAASAWKRRERKELAQSVTASESTGAVDGLTWQQFELLVGEAFRSQGYAVVETGGGGADGGVDLRLTRNRETYLVQCKHWKAFTVGVDVVRELYGVMAAKGAAGGFVVTSGRFTQEATRFADGRNVRLVDGTQLHAMFALVPKASASRAPDTPAVSPTPTHSARMEPALSPACPICNGPMLERTAKRGANAGSKFLGCIGYPACRGTRKVACS